MMDSQHAQLVPTSSHTTNRTRRMSISQYIGPETVHFKYLDMRGQFHHDGQSITHITCNLTTMRDLRNCLAEIGIYCRWGFDQTTARNYQSMKREVRKYICDNIHIFLAARVSDLHECVSKYPTPTQIGKLKLNPACEYQALGKCSLQVSEDLNRSPNRL